MVLQVLILVEHKCTLNYFFLSMIASMQVRKCDVCQRMNRKLTTGVPELHPVLIHSPWYMVGIDFVGPLSPPSDGNSYILTLSDYFTKWVCGMS